METVCMKFQSLFSGKSKKTISKCCLLKFLHSMQRQNDVETQNDEDHHHWFRIMMKIKIDWSFCFRSPFTGINKHKSTFNQFSRRQIDIFSLFFAEKGFYISCSLSPKETVCMKMSSPFFWEKWKKIKVTSAETFVQHAEHFLCHLLHALTF